MQCGVPAGPTQRPRPSASIVREHATPTETLCDAQILNRTSSANSRSDGNTIPVARATLRGFLPTPLRRHADLQLAGLREP